MGSAQVASRPLGGPEGVRFSMWVEEGMRLHGEGSLGGAAECYRRAHEADARDADALLLLGVAARQSGRYDEAIQLTMQAIRLRPGQAHFELNLGMAFFAAGRLDAAEISYRDALALDERSAEGWVCQGDLAKARARYGEAQICYARAVEARPRMRRAHLAAAHLLIEQERFEEALEGIEGALKLLPGEADLHLAAAVAAAGLERRGEAIGHCQRAIALRPGFAEAYLTLGNALCAEKDVVGATLSYESAARLRPGYVEALCNLAVSLLKLRRLDEAVRCARQAVDAAPERGPAQHVLGAALLAQGDQDGAEECFREAVRLRPETPEYWNSLGGVLVYRRPAEEAEACYRRAIALRPEFAAAHVNLGTALKFLGRTEEMRAEYELGLALDPASPGAQYNLSLTNLRAGRYEEGWKGHEWRWEFAELRIPKRGFRQPQWKGEELDGRTILLHAEQGFGDAVQFVRYAQMVAARGGRVVLECGAELCRLMRSAAGVSEVVARGAALPGFEVQCPLMSLPYVFGTEVQTIPSWPAYLSVDDADVKVARERFPGDGLRVGVVWAGNPRFRSDGTRSMPFAALRPLLGMEGVTVFSLQKGQAVEWIANAGEAFGDFYDTAAMMRTLDVVISVDTSTAHLTGALGVPVWVMLPHLADWRWLEEREDSPWYPSARLFRQRVPGDWDGVVERVVESLKGLLVA